MLCASFPAQTKLERRAASRWNHKDAEQINVLCDRQATATCAGQDYASAEGLYAALAADVRVGLGRIREEGVRLAQKMQVGLRTPVGIHI